MKLRDVAVVAAILAGSILALRWWSMGLPYYQMIVERPWELDGIWWRTIPAALQAALFWSVGVAIFGGAARRFEPRLDLVDRLLAGVIGLWTLAYVGGNLLGPIGLFRSWTVWALLAAIYVWQARGHVVGNAGAFSSGRKIVVLTAVLTLPLVLLVQLGSPVPPYMDILATPAAAQRILTFGRYLPFDSDPYGYWGHALQCPGTELLYALVALGAGIHPAVLAASASIVPLSLAFILATYRFGRSLGGDVAGGMATLLLTATVMFHVLPYSHGRFVSFIPAAVGLGFLLAPSRNATRIVLGAIAIAIAIACHAIIGALAALVVTTVLIRERWGVVVLAGIGVLALPEVLIALHVVVPYPVLPVLQGVGLGLIVYGAPRLKDLPLEWPSIRVVAVVAAVAIFLWCPGWSGLSIIARRYPLLYVGTIVGLALTPVMPRRVFVIPIVAGLITAFGMDCVSRLWWRSIPNPTIGLAVEDLYHKIEYWLPYLMVLPTAMFARRIADAVGVRAATYALLAAVSVPWVCRVDGCDPNLVAHSLVQDWGHSLEFAKHGYWGSTGDRRWAQSPTQFAVRDILLAEVEAGRITMDTHIAAIEPAILLYQDTVLFSVYTGINADTYIEDWVLDRSTAAGRFYPVESFDERTADAPPPYIVIHEYTLNDRRLRNVPPTPPEYEELLNEKGVRLLRRRSG